MCIVVVVVVVVVSPDFFVADFFVVFFPATSTLVDGMNKVVISKVLMLCNNIN